ncbi:unnamed protein product [Protopolystoma xenopodis]|uniref:Uncharacterized protein n=1 Tax=Protopolystoma xenopodis TaxID=117903 RepID=A0A3S5B5H5_9PLAT|nr:unnamed protein product [Protopolystoma xenopodis]
MPAKRLGMCHVHGPILAMMMHLIDSGLEALKQSTSSKRNDDYADYCIPLEARDPVIPLSLSTLPPSDSSGYFDHPISDVDYANLTPRHIVADILSGVSGGGLPAASRLAAGGDAEMDDYLVPIEPPTEPLLPPTTSSNSEDTSERG